jgi:hypothetical protein
MRPIIVTPRRALEAADKHRKFLADWKTKLAQHQIDKESRKNGEPDIHHFLVARGEPSTFTHRQKLAKQLGMGTYYGKQSENENLLKMLKLKEGYQQEHPTDKKEPNAVEEYLKLLE